MRLGLVLVLAVLGFGMATVVPDAPLGATQDAQAVCIKNCPPGGGLGICWGPHERPQCI